MFPFIWWLSEQVQPGVVVDGGGADFMRRRAIMAAAVLQSWSPLRLNPLLGLEAVLSDLTLNADPDVTAWRSRGSDSQTLAAAANLVWLPNGWGSGKGTPNFTGAPFLSATTGTIISALAGTDQPFSVLCTLQQTLVADHVICCWDDTTPGNSIITVRTDNAGTGRLRLVRTDAAGSSVVVTGGVDVGLEHQRVGISFNGTSAALYVGRTLDLSQACDVGDLTLNRFRIGTGPVIDAFSGYIPSFWVVPRSISASEWASYYDYSVKTWG